MNTDDCLHCLMSYNNVFIMHNKCKMLPHGSSVNDNLREMGTENESQQSCGYGSNVSSWISLTFKTEVAQLSVSLLF